MSRREWDEAQLRRRLEVLSLPVVPLRREGRHAVPPSDLLFGPSRESASATAYGIGPEHDLLTVWQSADRPGWAAVTRTLTGTSHQSTVLEVQDAPSAVRFVQPLPGGLVLLSAARQRTPDMVSTKVYDGHGTVTSSGGLGDALEHVLTTSSGDIWVGYVDENPGPVARYDRALRRQPPTTPPAPWYLDCYALNVDGESAMSCGYTDFHMVRMDESRADDLGRSPHQGARALLVGGDRAVLVGGYGGEYDLLVPVRFTSEGVEPWGEPRRLVLPNGLEVRGAHHVVGRGQQLHVVVNGDWFRLPMSEVVGN